jgi:hypothetical protein
MVELEGLDPRHAAAHLHRVDARWWARLMPVVDDAVRWVASSRRRWG